MVIHKNLVLNSIESKLNEKESRMRNDRQTVFALVRDLVQAQFFVSDQELVNRLWQDVADRDVDINRVINLMYTCSDYTNDIEMTEADETYQNIIN